MIYSQKPQSKSAPSNIKAYFGEKTEGTISTSEIENVKQLTVKRDGILDTTIVITNYEIIFKRPNGRAIMFKASGSNVKTFSNNLQKGDKIIFTNIYVKTFGVKNSGTRLKDGIVLTVE